MFFFDPTYLLFILPGVALSLWASFRTKSAFRTYSKVPCARQLTGAQAARLMLDRAGLHHVGIGTVTRLALGPLQSGDAPLGPVEGCA